MEKNTPRLFERDNLLWMGVGAALILAGILLMAGGKSTDPNVFVDNEVYGFRRITVAPILILLGLATEVYAIMKRGRED
jgi:hypothetical protein